MAMMKSLVVSIAALGAVAAALPAQAQTHVTIYGRVNTSVERTKIEGQGALTQVVNNSSRLGVKGTEDLGSGMNALYNAEFGFNSDTGGFGQRRDVFVGLKTNFGTVKLGNITSPLYFATYDYISLHNHDTGTSSEALGWFPAMGNVFVNNSVTYLTPSMGGLALELQYGLAGEQPSASGQKPRHYSATLTFDRGPLHVGLGYGETKNTRNLVTAADNTKDNMLVLSAYYDMGPVVLGGLVERDKSDNGAFRAGESHTRNFWRVVGMVPMGAHELHANYGQARDWSGTSDTGGKQWTLAYNYNLSKRTKVYAFYTKIDNDKATSAGGGGAYTNLGAPVGLDESSFALGLRHNF